MTGLPLDHRLFRDELFVPFLVVGEVDSLDQALAEANDTPYGLTAGIFSQDDDEIRRFLDTIQAGVVYVNRRAGATTGAWPGIQSLRRLEGLRLVRQERPWPVLRPAVPARAVADRRGRAARLT